MRRAIWAILLAVLTLAANAAEGGNLGILADVHGYHTGKAVLVPLRGLAEWAGAEVTFSNPTIVIRQGSQSIRLALGSATASLNGTAVALPVAPKAYGGITCVPLRFVTEALGMTATYHARGSGSDEDPELLRSGFVPVVVVRKGEETARVIVHNEPPNVVSSVLADVQSEGWGSYGTGWIMAVGKIHGNTAKAFGPTFYYADDGGAFSPTECSDNDLLRRGGRWQTQGH